MTSPQVAHALALIAAAQARIEGMKVANASIDLRAYPPTYSEQDFMYEAQELEALAIRVLQE